ncbi:MAG: AAA domain-containing protein [Saprospiraceae bacterium]
MLSQQEQQWFEELTDDRLLTVKSLKKTGLIEVFVSHIVDTYRESAHFIYELLQNADDAKATKASFAMDKDGVFFAHNGSINFSISDTKTERDEGIIPGHINAITTFSLSTKKEDIENKIGKFGIGFKSVFQYTDTPYIDNPPYNFKIEEFMIPRQNPEDTSIVAEGETTVFWLPFDKKEKTANESYEEILVKIKQINNPLLFLQNLKEISFEIDEKEVKRFSKNIQSQDASVLPTIEIVKIKLNEDLILRFDKKVVISDSKSKKHTLPISLAYIIDKDGNVSNGKQYKHYFEYAWCFFQTREPSKLNFIVNAPFILTPNREGIKENRIENDQLVIALSNLVEDSIQGLKSLGYINEEFFGTIANPATVDTMFKLLAQKAVAKLKSGEFIPTKEGDYITFSNAYVCTDVDIDKLLSYDNYTPLKRLTTNENARIVFRERKGIPNAQFEFIYKEFSSEKSELQAFWIGSKYRESFIWGMPEDFDILFFKFLIDRQNTILSINQSLWKKKFIPVEQEGKIVLAAPPHGQGGFPKIYIGGNKIPQRLVLVDYLAQDNEIKNFCQIKLGCIVPDDFHDFLNLLDRYDGKNEILLEEIRQTNLQILNYLKSLSKERREEMLAKLKSCKFISVIDSNGANKMCNPFEEVVYYPSEAIKAYFNKAGGNKNWANTNVLSGSILEEDIKYFYTELRVFFRPVLFTTKNFDGLEEFIKDVSLAESLYIAEIIVSWKDSYSFSLHHGFFNSTDWLYDSSGIRKKPNEIKLGDLHEKYSSEFHNIHIKLGFYTEPQNVRYANLSEEEKAILQAVEIGELTADEIKQAIADTLARKKSKAKENSDESNSTGGGYSGGQGQSFGPDMGTIIKKLQEEQEKGRVQGNKLTPLPKSSYFWDNSSNGDDVYENPGGLVSAPVLGGRSKDDLGQREKMQLEKEIELTIRREEMKEFANQLEPYSFLWFKTLLELEDNFTAEDRVKRNPINVVFSKADLKDGLLVLSETPFIPANIEDIGELSLQLFYGDSKKTVVGEVVSPKRRTLTVKLSNLDQLGDINLLEVTRVVVSASTPDFILEKLKEAFRQLNFQDTDLLNSPSILPSDLNFVFGPPGTGKTTYLSWLIGGKNPSPLYFKDRELKPLMDGNCKILVLTPTNKAADVLVERILKNYVAQGDYPDWLIRFGQTGTLDNESVFVGDRKLKPWVNEKCALVTTIARLPYDHFEIERSSKAPDKWKIKDFNWDYVIFDEASMIQQAAILYAIFSVRQRNPNVKFYIGGDPFQIPPIIQFEHPYWKYLPEPAIDNEGNPILDDNGLQMEWRQDGGNIYAFTDLMKDDSFATPRPKPHDFTIHNLTTQYRSLTPIGALFSHYRYGGILKHFRSGDNLKLGNGLQEKGFSITNVPLKTLNIIQFPVSKYSGIYRARTINGSPYHIYTAVFAVELLNYIQKNCALGSGQERYRIGVICPYAFQNTIISKLLEKTVSGPIEIVAGTVHGFQGDECDLVIVMLNPPKFISKSPRSFLNKKNILNVAISRARDKMIVLAPTDTFKEVNVKDLHQIGRIVNLMENKEECKDNVLVYDSTAIENTLWGSSTFIEEITFDTSHQSVNIYTDPITKYEFRQDENAVDVQVKTL